MESTESSKGQASRYHNHRSSQHCLAQTSDSEEPIQSYRSSFVSSRNGIKGREFIHSKLVCVLMFFINRRENAGKIPR